MKTMSIVLGILLCSQFTFAQWEQTNGPYGGTIFSISSTYDRIFAGTRNSGLYMSQNEGGNWANANYSLSSEWVEVVAGNDSIIYAGGFGLSVSTDDGNNWTSILPEWMAIRAILISGDTIFYGSTNSFSYSVNHGQTWIPLNPPYLGPSVKSMAKVGNTILAGTVSNGIMKTTIPGSSWVQANNGLMGNYINAMTTCGSDVYAAVLGGGLYKSSDSGQNWSPVNQSLEFCFLYALETYGNIVLAGSDNGGVSMSDDGGTTWTLINNNLPNTHIWTIHAKGNAIYVGTDLGGIYKTTNLGTTWTEVNNGILNATINCFTKTGDKILSGSDNGLFVSADQGMNWEKHNEGLVSAPQVECLWEGSTKTFAGVIWGGLNVSDDEGNTWSLLSNEFSLYPVNEIKKFGNRLFTATYHGLYFSDDEGNIWTQATAGLPQAIFTSLGSIGNTIFTSAYDSLYKSLDGGYTWSTYTDVSTSISSVYAFTVAGGKLFCIDNSLIYCYNETTGTWEVSYTLPQPGGGSFSDISSFNDILFASNYLGGGVLMSADTGATWISFNTGLSNLNVSCVSALGNYLYAGTNCGAVYRRPLSEIVSVKDNESSEAIKIFPNPASDCIIINVPVRLKTPYKAEIISFTGETVSKNNFAGPQFNLDLKGINPGLYLVKLISGDQILYKKLLIQ